MSFRWFRSDRPCAVATICLSLSMLLLLAGGMQTQTKHRLNLNGDYNCFFAFEPINKTNAGELIDQSVDAMAASGVTVYLGNTTRNG